MKEIYNIVELFSGIGSQARALKNIGININVQATCEWDMHAFIAYDAMHESYENLPEVEKMTKEQILEILKKYTEKDIEDIIREKPSLHRYPSRMANYIYNKTLKIKEIVKLLKTYIVLSI